MADEVPSTIILEDDEEPGEIPDEQEQSSTSARPFTYDTIDEAKILSNSKRVAAASLAIDHRCFSFSLFRKIQTSSGWRRYLRTQSTEEECER